MKISIVTICYNQKKFINKCLDSVANQKNADYEHIVVDPGSTDGSREIIQNRNNIIKVFKKDSGPAEGLNNGFNAATGNIFGFINADDYLLPNSLEKISVLAEKYKESLFVTGNGIVIKHGVIKKFKPTEITYNRLLYRSAIMFQPSTFFSKFLFEKAGKFNISNHTCWDYELFLKISSLKIKNILIDDSLAAFRIHSDSITGTGRLTARYNKDLSRIFSEHKKRQWKYYDSLISTLFKIQNHLTRFPQK